MIEIRSDCLRQQQLPHTKTYNIQNKVELGVQLNKKNILEIFAFFKLTFCQLNDKVKRFFHPKNKQNCCSTPDV